MRVSDFHFELPDRLIAKFPTRERTASRLLHLDAATGDLAHCRFRDLLTLVEPADLLVFNDTRVIPARLYGHKATGGRVEILLERVIDDNVALAQIKSTRALKSGTHVTLDDSDYRVVVKGRRDDFYEVEFPDPGVLAIAHQLGHVPLPPYIDRPDESIDRERYQTVFGRRDGAVAAPTAGLHFDDALMEQLAARGADEQYVTLHVGAGTFQPVRVDRVEDHRMHAEYVEVGQAVCEAVEACKARGGRVIAVGTTAVRSLETAAANAGSDANIAPWTGDTDIFIYPGYEFRVVDAMITNFHLPGSTLVMLVSAFAGQGNIMRAYRTAIEDEYRFFSYGDAMLITR